jgi:hypothetical protein
LHKSHKNPKGAILLLFCAISTGAYSPDAESVLEILRERLATGLASQEDYDAFLAGLDEPDNCDTWAEDPPDDPETRAAVKSICPELRDGDGDGEGEDGTRGKRGRRRSRVLASQAVQPRRMGASPPFFRADAGSADVRASLSLRDFTPFDRHVEVTGEGLTLQAGHLHPDMADTRLGFVAGSRFYAGWSGGSGFTGPLASPQAALEGLGLAYHAGGWHAQAVGTWNRLLPRGSRPAPDRRDALLYALGLSHGRFRFQVAHERFETAAGPALAVSVGGLQASDRQGRWRLGVASSYVDAPSHTEAATRAPAYGGYGSYGGYGEIGLGSEQGAYRLEGRQASADWTNPLQSPRGHLQDTLEGQWILPGRGEGGLSLRTRLPLFTAGGYRAEWTGGGGADWALGAGITGSEARLALIQRLGAWSYEAGTGLRYRRTHVTSGTGADTSAGADPGSSGFGQILGWGGSGWTARLSLTARERGYRGPYPEPLAVSLRKKSGRGRGWDAGGEAFIGDLREPASYVRLVIRQEWELGGGMALRHALRLPWSRGTGWAGDMGYQLGLEASL